MRHLLVQLGSEAVRLAAAWWRTDCPRISRREGRLLRITPPAIIRVNAEPAEVLSRSIRQTMAGPSVVYDCCVGRESCQLRITLLAGVGSPDVRWIQSGRETLVSENDVEVFPLRTDKRR